MARRSAPLCSALTPANSPETPRCPCNSSTRSRRTASSSFATCASLRISRSRSAVTPARWTIRTGTTKSRASTAFHSIRRRTVDRPPTCAGRSHGMWTAARPTATNVRRWQRCFLRRRSRRKVVTLSSRAVMPCTPTSPAMRSRGSTHCASSTPSRRRSGVSLRTRHRNNSPRGGHAPHTSTRSCGRTAADVARCCWVRQPITSSAWTSTRAARSSPTCSHAATTPERVYRHEWSVGDTVIWDNRGVLHRVAPYEASSGREMLRTTILGDEPIQ